MNALEAIASPVQSFLDPGERVYWLYIATTLAFALVIFMMSDGRSERLSGFFKFCFPASLWRHRSARTDVVFFVINRVVYALMLAPLAVAAYPFVNYLVTGFLQYFGTPGSLVAPTWVVYMYALVALAAFDFAIYLAHLAQHKWSFLWQFHKVHHSAEVLNPLTAYRMHPVDDFLTLTTGAILAGTAHSIFSFFWADSFSSIKVTVTSLAVMSFYLLGYHLRHSHIWLSYGPFMSQLLISPAQHQIHHSREHRHADRNFGFIFAVWDKLFGTLYVPRDRETFELGLSDGSSAAYHSAVACYIKPFRDVLSPRFVPGLLLLTTLIGVSAVTIGAEDHKRAEDSVFLESLTTSEVSKLISSGYRTVIIPTGGVEQNGEHAILGKHNLVVMHAAEEIARTLGKTLVAPVIAYVPQGGIDPPSDHMRFAGTVSLRESTFEAILEDVTRSLIHHGFSHIYFIGDSAGNQAAQQRIADRLSAEFASSGTSVVHVNDYYENNGQFDWLLAQGYSDEQIGWHAGLRDTSELLHVAPQTIRERAMRLSSTRPGVSGAYWRASDDIGQVMLDLKIRAAVRQIRNEP